uniref:Probable DNA polymerase n=1 Tax=Fomitiporia mediterranea TaxID=208960 RepID=A0A5B9RD88_9AGAM|nr:DNA polymerase family B [Fomitiporia mediterranea]QEG57120.1 DNA polymerase family B [Fomitiporia mediterranea]
MKLHTIKIRSILKERYLRDHLTKFFRTNNFNTQYIDLIVKISGDSDSIFYSLSKFTSIDLNNMPEKVNFVNQVVKKFNILSDAYESKTSINNKILIYYKEVDERSYKKYVRNINMSTKLNKFSDEILPVNNIPYNTDYKGWGIVTPSSTNPGSFIINDVYFDNNIDHIIVDYINYNLNKITIFYKDNNVFKFSDFKTKNDKFQRSFNTGLVVYFDEDKPFFSFDDSVQKPVYKKDKEGNPTKERLDIIKPINPLSVNENEEQIESAPDFNIVTFDIETYSINNVYNILSVCFGRTFVDQNQFYIGDYKSTNELLKAVFDKLFSEEFNKSIVYIHNGVNFDLIFIVKFLLSLKSIEITPIYKDGKFLSLTIRYGKYKTKKGKIGFHYVLTIRDSMLLLPSSLSKLAKSFDVKQQKDIFPYNFPNKNNLNYVGEVPGYNFFDPKKVSIEDYNKYVESFKGSKWNLKTETLNYCSKDCISLHQILINFCELVYNKFMVNALTCPTLPSLAFKVFRTMFLPNNIEIPLLIKAVYDNIYQAYYGGHVDLYVPKGPILDNGKVLSVNKIKELNIPKIVEQKGIDYIKKFYNTVKHYDINSLYPKAMSKFKYPTDIIGYFIGDITLIENYVHLVIKVI